jgi:SAM-dependent methyltransferase
MKLVRSALESAKRHGVLTATKIAGNLAIDLVFDWKHGTDTIRWVETDELEPGRDAASAPHRSPYRATKMRPLLKLLRRLDLPRECVFVDIGSGKGRVLLIAAQYGFRKVVGVEFSPALCVIARANIERFRAKSKLRSAVEVVEGDAAAYQFAADDCVLFMFNPFDGYILTKVVRNLGDSLRKHPRRLCVIYNTPRYHEVLDASGLFSAKNDYEIGGNQFRVYTT